MPMIFRVAIVDRRKKILIEAASLTAPSEEEVRALAATAERFGLGEPEKCKVAETMACRACGCTHDRPCRVGNRACSWVEPDLCSACGFVNKPNFTGTTFRVMPGR